MGKIILINHTKLISKNRAKSLLSKISEAPMALPLVKLFERLSNPENYRLGEGEYLGIYGSPNNKEIRATMILKQKNDYVNLDILGKNIEEITYDTEDSFLIRDFYKLTEIYARPKTTGVWAYGFGYQKTYTIKVNIPNQIILPSKRYMWLFNQLNWLAMISGEFCLNDQPKFWDGSKEKPD